MDMEKVLQFVIENWDTISSVLLAIITLIAGKIKIAELVQKIISIVEEATLQKMKAKGNVLSSSEKKAAAMKLWNSLIPKSWKPFLIIPGIRRMINFLIDKGIEKAIRKNKEIRESLKDFITI